MTASARTTIAVKRRACSSLGAGRLAAFAESRFGSRHSAYGECRPFRFAPIPGPLIALCGQPRTSAFDPKRVGRDVDKCWAFVRTVPTKEGGMPELTAKQDRADRKLAKYISRRSLTLGIVILSLVILTAILYGSYGG